MKLYVMRHGQTDWNKAKKLQGRSDIPLNENGIALARQVGEHLKDIPFAFAISSPLSRAMETAKLALAEREIPIYPDERIGEMSFGDWEGLAYQENGEIPEGMMDHFFRHTALYKAPPNGESFEQVIERTHDLYEELRNNPAYEDCNILISSHGAASRAFLQSVFRDGDFWHGGVPGNCAVTILEIVQGQVVSIDLDHIFYE